MVEGSLSTEQIILACMVMDYTKYYLDRDITRDDFKVELSKELYDIIVRYEWNEVMIRSKQEEWSPELLDYVWETLAWGLIFWGNIEQTFNTAYEEFKRTSSLGDMKKTAEEILSWVRMWKSPNELMKLVNQFYVYQPEEKSVEELTEEILGDMSWENEVISYKTGFNNLDQYLNWFLPWQLNIIAGTSSTGKSLIAVNFILKHLMDKRKVAFFSLEMTNKEILQRMFANLTWTPMNAIKDKTSKDNYEKVKELASWFTKFIDWNLFMYDDKLTLAWIVSEIRALNRKTKIDLVYIDYLGIISVAKWENRNLEVATITRTLKLLAKELKLTIVALAQLNREADKWDKVPELSHLRDSWAIWQDADDVIMALNLWKSYEWEDKYTEEQRRQILRFYIRKNRNWPTWEADLRVIYSKMQLTDDLSFRDNDPF